MQRQHQKLLMVICVLLLLSAGFAYYAMTKPVSPQTSNQPHKNKETPVQVAVSQRQDVVIWRDVPATFVPVQQVVIRPQISGQIAQLLFSDGQYVRQGQLLAILDDRAIVAEDAQALARIQRLFSAWQQAHIEHARAQRLLSDRAISQQEVDQLAARSMQLKLEHQEALAARQAIAVRQSYTRMTAPFAGQVGIRQVSVGAQVSSSDPQGIVTLTQVDPLAVEFGVPAAVLEQGGVSGQSVELWSLQHQTLLGNSRIRVQDSQLNANTGTLTVRALWSNPDHRWVAGQTLRVRLPAQRFSHAITVPLVAVQQGLNDSFVMVVQAEKAKRQTVEVLGQTDELAIVRGLDAGVQVVVDGLARLKDGARVKPAAGATPTQGVTS